MVFVHGSPGSWEAFVDLLADGRLVARAHLAALDRLGFGGSARSEDEPSLVAQAAALAPVLAGNRSQSGAILVGHSLGAPIVVRAAADMPGRIAGLVLVAPSLAPTLERPWWIQRPTSWPLFAWLLPVDWRSCNRELITEAVLRLHAATNAAVS